MSELYPERILQHYREPHHFGPLAGATHHGEAVNHLCGDDIKVHLRVAGDRVEQASFEGVGCAISQAAASLLMQEIQGIPIAQLREFGEDRIVELLGVPLSPRRMECATLVVAAAKRAAG